MSPPSDSDILVFPTESDNTQDSTTKIIELKKETESLSSDSSDPVNEEKISVEVRTHHSCLMGQKNYNCLDLSRSLNI